MAFKMIAVGDNVCDCYLDEGVYYPGGNAVNVAVNCKKNGLDEVAYIGMFGNDEKAEHLKKSLTEEGVTFDRSRTMHAISGSPGVRLIDGDRKFVGGPKNTAQHIARIRLMPEDLEYIAGFGLCHTSCFSSIEYELPAMSETCQVSFDFSERMEDEYLRRVCPYLTYAFFSGSHMSPEEIDALIDRCHELGTKVVGVTRGSKGALFSEEGKRYEQGVKFVKAVDTMGAGDSFIAGFLTKRIQGANMVQALDFAATVAAQTCLVHGGWGHPHVLPKEEMRYY